ncbi:MAG TPA: aldolase/citrate lyase family protein [Vicinamibacteria bacterium]|nr:aldolase/citrate lyase family protein [Vicinamibacteria bacterium]
MPIPSRVPTLTLVLALAAAGLAGQYQTPPAAEPAPPGESSLKKALLERRPVIGATVTVPNVDTALTLANAGFDFLWIEMEHGPITLESLRAILLATRGTRAVPITRVPANEVWLAKRVLDEGSLGVIFPFTSTRELAERAVAACRYPPLGDRGFGPALALSRYGMSGPDYVRFANENVAVVVIIERKEAVENIEAIASVPGISVLFVGVNDLSFSLGVGGRTTDPLVEQALTRILEAGRRHGIPVGYPTGNPTEINKRIAQGFRFFQASSDIGLMAGGARDMLSKVDRSAR